MPNHVHHSGHPIGAVGYVPKTFNRRGAFIRYITADNVIWLLKPDVESYFAQLKRLSLTQSPKPNGPPAAVGS